MPDEPIFCSKIIPRLRLARVLHLTETRAPIIAVSSTRGHYLIFPLYEEKEKRKKTRYAQQAKSSSQPKKRARGRP